MGGGAGVLVHCGPQQIQYIRMEDIDGYDISLTIKQLKLAVKFPCKLTFHHLGKPISPEIPSSPSNVFPLNKDVSLRDTSPKDYLDITIHLATDKGGNIMAGILKLNLKDAAAAEGQTLTLALQKCLDPYATCSLLIRSVKLNRSRVKKLNLVDDKRSRPLADSKFQTKSQAPFVEVREVRPRVKYNQAQSFLGKRVSFNQPQPYLKEKALSTAGFKAMKDSSFEKDDFNSRFKHLNKRVEQEDSKTVITGKWRDPDHLLKSSLEANEKTLKLEIAKYKTKFEESERAQEDKNKQIKTLKDQLSDLNRQLNEKQYLVEELNNKTAHINKLEENNRNLSKQLHEERNRIIDLERELEEERNATAAQLAKVKEEADRRDYDNQKAIYEKKEEVKELQEENHYKVNQINKMKALIEDLERNIEVKIYEYERNYNQERNEHAKNRAAYHHQLQELNNQLELQAENIANLTLASAAHEEDINKLTKRNRQLEESLYVAERALGEETSLKERLAEEKRRAQKSEEDLTNRIKQLQKDYANKERELTDITNQLTELSLTSKKKIVQLLEKNKQVTSKIQEMQSKLALSSAAEQKTKRALQLAQKESRSLIENEKILTKNLKMKDERILQIEKELSELDNKNTIKQSLTKKDVEYKSMQLEKIHQRLSEIEKNYEKEKENSEDKRLELLRMENKLRITEEASNRVAEQLKEAKLTQTKREEEWQERVRELEQQLKQTELRQNDLSKELHSHDIDKINLRNQLNKLEKILQNSNEKYDRLKKRETDLENTIKQLNRDLQARTEEIVQLESDFKSLQNDFKLLQADKSKNEKITTIISEEKDTAKSDISKLKKEIEKRQQREEQHQQESKQLREQISKLEMKVSTVTKEYEKFKNTITESVKTSLIVKQTYQTDSPADNTKFLQRSRVNRPQQDYSILEINSELKFAEIIEGFAKESQQSTAMLNEELRKLKRDKEALERDYNSLTNRAKQSQEEHVRTLKEMSNEIQSLMTRSSVQAEQHEEKISQLEKELSRKDKDIRDLMNEIQQVSNSHENERSSHEISIGDLLSKIDSLKFKLNEWERKDENNCSMFVNFQQKIIEIEQENVEISHQIEVYIEMVSKKEKIILQKTEECEEIRHELEVIKKSRSELSIELLSARESLAVEKENIQRLLHEIKDEQNKNTQLKGFNSDLLKEKEALFKRDFEKAERIYNLEEQVQSLMVEMAEKNEEVTRKNMTIQEYKDNLKISQTEVATLQALYSETKLSLEKERERLKDKQRRITEKDAEIEGLSAQNKRQLAKYQGQISKLTEEHDALVVQLTKEREESSSKLVDMETTLKRSREGEKKLSQANISLQQQIFFEKQTNSLNFSKIEELRQQITDLQIANSKQQLQINSLNDQIKEKEQTLYALSGKLYTSDNRLQNKEQEFRRRLQKVELDWRYKIEEICEEYENKLEIIERQKNYVRTGMEEFNENVEKLQHDKTLLKMDLEKEKEVWEARIKKIEEEKLAALIDKNRQIEKLREAIEEQEEKIKRKELELKNMEDDRRKTEEKAKEMRFQLEKAEERRSTAVRALEKEVDQLKRKEGQLKRFKDALKNNQWTIEREIKKGIQSTTKSIVGVAPEQAKGEIMQWMRNLEVSVAKLACPNIDEL